MDVPGLGLHTPAVLAPYFEQSIGDLAECAHFYAVHQFGKHVCFVSRNLLQTVEGCAATGFFSSLKRPEAGNLLFLFRFSRSHKRDGSIILADSVWREERVDTYHRKAA